MTLDQNIEDWKQGVEQVPWDAVRERRVLARLVSHRRSATGHWSRRWRLGAAALAASAVVVMLGFVVFGTGGESGEPAQALGRGLDQVESATIATAGKIRLQDGSVATYLTPAVVEVEQQSSTAIHLSHLHGQVRYQVVRSPDRTFVVNANGIEIQVVGTIFVVDVDLVDVHVKVERGEVVVDSGSGIVELGAGEEIILACRDSSTTNQLLGRHEPKPGGLSVTIDAPEGPLRRGDIRNTPSFDQLLREADRARRAGDNDLAASELKKLISLFPGNGRIVSVMFKLGK
ncbi:MAG: FecR domain-containing protein, partial [Deltaproteobacteria bacterium]|nr:FecR domain-containing protein [Deltaproteobacteria bacterium]